MCLIGWDLGEEWESDGANPNLGLVRKWRGFLIYDTIICRMRFWEWLIWVIHYVTFYMGLNDW